MGGCGTGVRLPELEWADLRRQDAPDPRDAHSPGTSPPHSLRRSHGGRAAEDHRRLESLLFPTTKRRRLEPRLFSSPVAVEDRRVQPPSLLDGARYPSWPISSTNGHGESRRRRSRQLLPISSPCVKEGGQAMEKLRVLLPPLPSPPCVQRPEEMTWSSRPRSIFTSHPAPTWSFKTAGAAGFTQHIHL